GREAARPERRLLGRERVGLDPFLTGVLLVDPGPEVLRLKVGERQQEIREVTLRVYRDRRDAVEGGLLDERYAESRLAASGHADRDSVCDQVFRVVQDE